MQMMTEKQLKVSAGGMIDWKQGLGAGAQA